MIGPHGENLIFVISQPRAGSTLLQRILAGHPAVFATAEPWIMLHPLYALREKGHTAEYNEDWARAALKDFCENLEGGEQAYLDAVRTMGLSLYNRALQPSGRQCFLDKTPRYYHICGELRRTFPQAKFILLLRNPIAILSSILTSWIKEDWSRLDSYRADLLQAPGLIARALEDFGPNGIVIRYETFVEDPERNVRDLCGRLELPFDPAMIEYGNSPKPKGRMGDNVGIDQYSRPVLASKEKWLEQMATPRRRLLAESYLASLDESVLNQLGYPREELATALRSNPLDPMRVPADWREHAQKFFGLSTRTMAAVLRQIEGQGNASGPNSSPFAVWREVAQVTTPSTSATSGGASAQASAADRSSGPETSASRPPAGGVALSQWPLRPATQACLEEAEQQFTSGQLSGALEWLERALDLEPDRRELLLALANLQSQTNDLPGAYESLTRAAAQEPPDALTHVLLGSICQRLGKLEEFEAAIGRALELQPGHPGALRLLAGLNLQQGLYAYAAKLYHELLRLSPDDPEARLSLGKCLFELGDLASAATAFEAILAVHPNHALAAENLAIVRAKIRATPAAQDQAQAALNPCAGAPEASAGPAAKVVQAAPKPASRRRRAEAQQPLVSVIVSVYAAERYLRKCLEDLVAQTIFPELEVLIIDSGSPENERAIAEEFGRRHSNILYHRTERETLYAAWNRAIGLARGRYIANANADDAHRPDALELLAAALEEHPEADLAYGDYYTSTVPNDTFAQPHILRQVVHPPYHPATVMLYCLTGCHPMWRRTVFDKIGVFDPTYTAPGDYEFLFRFVQAGLRAVHVPQPLSLFYQNPDGLSWKSAAQTKNEGDRILGQYRTTMPIERLFRVDPANRSAQARAWTALGNLAWQHHMPWFSNYVQALPYALLCYERALQIDPACEVARENRALLLSLQPKAPAESELLRGLSPERMAAVRASLREGRVHPRRVDLPPAVDPIEFGPAPRPSSLATSAAIFPVPTQLQPQSDALSKLPVRLTAPFLNFSELAQDARGLALSLSAKIDLTTLDVSEPYTYACDLALPEPIRKALTASRTGFNFVTGGIGISLQAPGRLHHVQGAAYQIGRTGFEADRLPREAVRICNQMDELWVPSRATADIFAASGVEPDKLFVIPALLESEQFDPATQEPWPLPGRAALNFLAHFEWSTRKGWDALLAAYLTEFSAKEDVCLYLHVRVGERSETESRAIIQQQIDELLTGLHLVGRLGPRVELLVADLPPEALPRLYRAVDAVVCPSRGESWNRTVHRALWMGLPVIATGWGGHLDLINEGTGYLIDCELVPARRLELHEWPYAAGRWAEPSVSHLRELMRRVQRNPAEATARGAAGRAFVLENFSTESVTRQITARLQAIEEKLTKPSCPPATARSTSSRPNTSGAKTRSSLQVTWEGSFLDLGSLSHVNRELSRQLARRPGTKVTCVAKNVLPPELAKHRLFLETARRLHFPAPQQAQVTIRHAWPPNWERPAAGAWVLIQPWEYGVLPEDWTQRLTEVDEVWAPSEYARRVYLESGVDPAKVHVVPNGIDPDQFHPEVAPLALATKKTFKFLFVGGTIHRKGPDLLLQAYLDNFTASDDVCLVIKDFGGQSIYAGQTLEARILEARQRPDAPEILYLTEDLAPEALPGLYTACDCLVHPYRGEGFGLPVLEAMACGLPVIVTGGGATDDFATDEFAYRIPALRKEIGPSVGGLKLHRNGWLLEPDPASLAERMKWVAAYPDVARKKGQAASQQVRREWTWERAAQIAAHRLREIANRRAPSSAPPAKRAINPLALPVVARVGQLNEARERADKGDWPAAWEAAVQVLLVRPFHPEAYLLLAEISQAAGDSARARQLAEQARQMAPQWKPARQFLKKPPPKGARKVPLPELPPALRAAQENPRLSVFLITKNEERFLGPCLESIRGLAHQIVVADTGSTDATREIAARFGAEVLSVDWTDDFSAARNAALERVTGDWVLMLDADEELLPKQTEVVQAALRDRKVLAYRLPMVDEGREEEGVSYVPRLFRNAPGLFYVGRVHEQIFSSVEVRRAEWGLENKFGTIRLLHHGYTKELVRSRDKVARNLKLLQRALEEFPDEPNLLMNLGLELVRAGYLHEGLDQYSAAFRALSALPPEQVVPELRESLLTQLCTHLLAVKDYAAIGRALHSPLAVQGGLTATLHWLLGLACIESKQYAEGAQQMRQCLTKRHEPVLSPVNKNILKAGPHHCLALCLAAMKQNQAADQAFSAALRDDPGSRAVSFDYARFLADTGQGIEALKIIHQLATKDPSNVVLWQFGGQVALSQPEFAEFAADWTGEAINLFPAHPLILEQRAQALLLNGKSAEALPLWQRIGGAANPSHQAALLICQAALNQPLAVVPAELGPRLNQEFLAWYRRLLSARAEGVIRQVNERLEALRKIVPAAVQALEAALAEATAEAR
ncbi:MAG TPA: glycosyltransferase [Verrucomicrobiae bacterium]|nr:glycosyltransferase [Verrucomicrobiae bacterium]